MTDYVNQSMNSYVDPETGYSTIDTYNMITDMKFGNTKHIPSQRFPTLPDSSSHPAVTIFRNQQSGENYGTVSSAYGGSCVPQKYYVGKCPTNQFIRNLSEKPKSTPKPSIKTKDDILLIEVIIEEGLTGKPVYQVNTSAVPSWLKTSLQNAVGKVVLPAIYANRNPKSKNPYDFIFYQIVKKKLKAIPITLPQIQLVRKVPKQVPDTNAEVIGKMQYTYDEPGPMNQPPPTPMAQGPTPMARGPTPTPMNQRPMAQPPSPMAQGPPTPMNRPPKNQGGQPMNQGGQPMNQGGQPMNQGGQPINQGGQQGSQESYSNKNSPRGPPTSPPPTPLMKQGGQHGPPEPYSGPRRKKGKNSKGASMKSPMMKSEADGSGMQGPIYDGPDGTGINTQDPGMMQPF